jgi:hypothetical protein
MRPRAGETDPHRHIQTKISTKLSPVTTENLVYVYGNSKLWQLSVMQTSSRCSLGIMKMCSLSPTLVPRNAGVVLTSSDHKELPNRLDAICMISCSVCVISCPNIKDMSKDIMMHKRIEKKTVLFQG